MSGSVLSRIRAVSLGRPDDLDAVDAAAAEARVVVDEADDALAGGLAELAHEASTGATGADDQGAACGAVADAAGADHDRPLGEAGADDRDHADQRVDDEEGAA